MGFFTSVHYVGTFLLMVATIFLLVVSITSPVVDDLPLFTVKLDPNSGNMKKIDFGAFGWCVIADKSHNICYRHLGFRPTEVVGNYTSAHFTSADNTSTHILTHVFILHPIALVLSFIALILSLGTNALSSIAGSLLSFLAFVATIIVLACDFTTFTVIKHRLKEAADGSSTAAKGHWGPVVWLVVAAAICSLLATSIVFFTCLAHRRKSRSTTSGSFAKN